VLSVRAPVDKEAESGDDNGSSVAVDNGINVTVPMPAENTRAFFDRITYPDNALDVRMKMDVSPKPIKAESLAVNSLHHPASANPPPARRSIEAYQYLMDFTPRNDVVNLVNELPGINAVLAGVGLDHLVNVFRNMNTEMRQAVMNMESTNAGVHFVPGVAGCGKSYLLEFLILCVFYGARETFAAINRQGPSTSKVLYLLDNNIGLEVFYDRLKQTLESLGINAASHFPIIWLYLMEGEVRLG
jgi:hypothetical protein